MAVELTVFTEAISPEGTGQHIRSFFRPLKLALQGKKLQPSKKYGGHYAVTRSLVEGLKKNGVEFNYNPSREKDIAGNVIVLAGVERLKSLVELKNKGKMKILFAGPNICDSPLEENNLLMDPAIDKCIVPSEWIRTFFMQEAHALQNRVEIWHAGVDTEYWKPSVKEKQNKAIIYWKTEAEEFYLSIRDVIRQYGYEPVAIRYGSYSLQEYKEALNNSSFAVFISRSESQGIAMAEAWSMDVPVYAWDPGNLDYKKRNYSQVTSCPYLTNEAGLRWIDLPGLRDILEKTRNGIFAFQPRKYALRSFTDEHASAELINKFRHLSSGSSTTGIISSKMN